MTDESKNPSAERLVKLSKELGRIAGALVSVSSGQPASKSARLFGGTKEVSVDQVTAIIRTRRVRDQYFSSDLFADPAWDMLLELFAAELTNRRVPISELCEASRVPATTALRWLNVLVNKGVVVRRKDPLDARRVFVELTSEGSSAMKQYFQDLD